MRNTTSRGRIFIQGSMLAAALALLGSAVPADPVAQPLSQPWAADIVSLRLLDTVDRAVATKSLARSVTRDEALRVSTAGNLLCDVVLREWTDQTLAQFQIKGVVVVYASSKYRQVTVELLDPAAVYDLAKIPGVVMVKPCFKAESNAGLVNSQSYVALNVDKASNRYGVSGQGQKVGVLSDSFARTTGVRDGTTTPPVGESGTLRNARNQRTGDLPSEVELLRDLPANDPNATDEGAGMAELVHDIVPHAAIAFHTAFISDASFADGIDALRAAGSTVIVDDVFYFAEPMFQDGIIAQAARNSVLAGVPYFSSAGNAKNIGYRFNYRDFNPDVDTEASSSELFPDLHSSDDLHRWDNNTPFLAVTFLPFNTVTLVLQWNQPFQSVSPAAGAQIDLDMVFYERRDVHSNVVTILNDRQGTTGAPKGDALEIMQYTNPTSTAQTFYLAINHVRGMQDGIPQSPSTPIECRLVGIGAVPIIEGITSDTADFGGPTTYGHSVAEGVMCTGAIPWYDTPRFDTDLGAGPGIDAQNFTSRGGNLKIYFNDAGQFTPRDRFVPDIAATNGDNTTFFGGNLDLLGYQGEPDNFPNFFGTSAAAPNAAAVAALMKSLKPSLSPTEVKDILFRTAIDVVGRRAGPGIDDTTGAGLIDAAAALDDIAGAGGITPVPTPAGTPAPKFRREFVVNKSLDPEVAAMQSYFDGWIFESGGGSFVTPDHGDALGAPVLTTFENTNTFGFFSSPYFVAGPYEKAGDIPLNGNNGAQNLYRADFFVRSSESNQQLVPTIRFRASTESNEQSDMLVLTSVTPTNLSPTSLYSYRMFFTLPPTQNRFRLFYEVINTGGQDAANVNLILDQVDVTALSVSGLIDQQTEKNYDFRGPDSHGWGIRNAQPYFAQPNWSYAAEGLRLGPSIGGGTFFGFFASPEDDGGAPVFQIDRLYRARFKVRSDVSSNLAVPTFRVRVNDSSNNFSALVSLDSTTGNANVPTSNGLKTYDLYYETIPGIDFNRMLFSFDYLLVPGLGNSAAGTITLEQVEVSSFQTPLF